MDTKPYALITGASGGLGTAFALECAHQGHNLFLIDLNGPVLHSLGDFIRRNFDVSVNTFEIDLTRSDVGELVRDEVHRQGLRIFMLINNAGLAQNDLFEESDNAYLRRMIEVNCISYLSLIHSLLPELKKMDHSHIVNVSSLAGFYPLPRKSCYSATKGFVRQFSQALNIEVSNHGVTVSILCPGPMTTNINNYLLHRKLNWFSQLLLIHPNDIARYTLYQARAGRQIIIPGRINRILHLASGFVPRYFLRKLLRYSMNQLQTSRKNRSSDNDLPEPIEALRYSAYS